MQQMKLIRFHCVTQVIINVDKIEELFKKRRQSSHLYFGFLSTVKTGI